jgi:hypothetical protein
MHKFVVAYISGSGNIARDEGDQGLEQAQSKDLMIVTYHETLVQAQDHAMSCAREDQDTIMVLEVKTIVPAVGLQRKMVRL